MISGDVILNHVLNESLDYANYFYTGSMEKRMSPRILAVDIETTSLKANFGRIIVACFLDMDNGKVITLRGDSSKYKNKDDLSDDSLMAQDIKDILEDAWMWVTWFGKMFDIPFINTRLLLSNQESVARRLHCDLLYYSRKPNLCLSNSRLDTVSKTFEIESQKIDLLPKEWMKAIYLSRKEIDKAAEHCQNDVKALYELFPILSPFVRNIHY
jgi:uncharacterized protein YprB with RNaseH-like and TPR domain